MANGTDGTSTALALASDGTVTTKPAASAPGKTASRSDQSDDSSNAADGGAAAATATQIQPVAAAIALNTPLGAAPAGAPSGSASAAIGTLTKGHAKIGPSQAGDQDGPTAQDLKNDAKATVSSQTSASSDSGSTAPNPSAAPPGDNASAQVSGGNPTPQDQTRADTTAVVLEQTNSGVQADPDRSAPRADATTTTSTAGGAATAGQAGANAVKTDAGGLPNLGVAAANIAAPSPTAPTAAVANAAAVPVAGLAVAITARARAGANQFDIRLDPPELGRIDVRLDVDASGQVTSHVTVDRADTLQLLQSQQPQLERALEQAGLKTADNGLQFTLRDQSFTGQNNRNSGGTASVPAQLTIPDANLPPVQTTQIYTRWGLGTGVDIRV
ncbi:MAG TPA: flagellar hook-length control protein FliK [Xanthobacteraceae bacterium]|nr:flagellar hook-length control protein FliK [Xanthobacteraceae bacterium]